MLKNSSCADAFLRCMWTSDSSVLQFLQEAPSSVHYLFASYGREHLATPSLRANHVLHSALLCQQACGLPRPWGISFLEYGPLPFSDVTV